MTLFNVKRGNAVAGSGGGKDPSSSSSSPAVRRRKLPTVALKSPTQPTRRIAKQIKIGNGNGNGKKKGKSKTAARANKSAPSSPAMKAVPVQQQQQQVSQHQQQEQKPSISIPVSGSSLAVSSTASASTAAPMDAQSEADIQKQSAQPPSASPSHSPIPSPAPSSTPELNEEEQKQLKLLTSVREQIEMIARDLPTITNQTRLLATRICLARWAYHSAAKRNRKLSAPSLTPFQLELSRRRLYYRAGMIDENIMHQIFRLDSIQTSNPAIRQQRKATVIKGKEYIKESVKLRRRIDVLKEILPKVTEEEEGEKREDEDEEMKDEPEMKQVPKQQLEQKQPPTPRKAQKQVQQQPRQQTLRGVEEASTMSDDIPVHVTSRRKAAQQPSRTQQQKWSDEETEESQAMMDEDNDETMEEAEHGPITKTRQQPITRKAVSTTPQRQTAPAPSSSSASASASARPATARPPSSPKPTSPSPTPATARPTSAQPQRTSSPNALEKKYAHLRLPTWSGPSFHTRLHPLTGSLILEADVSGIASEDLQVTSDPVGQRLIIRGVKLPPRRQSMPMHAGGPFGAFFSPFGSFPEPRLPPHGFFTRIVPYEDLQSIAGAKLNLSGMTAVFHGDGRLEITIPRATPLTARRASAAPPQQSSHMQPLGVHGTGYGRPSTSSRTSGRRSLNPFDPDYDDEEEIEDAAAASRMVPFSHYESPYGYRTARRSSPFMGGFPGFW